MKSDVALRQQVNRLQLELNSLTSQFGGNSAAGGTGGVQPPRQDSPFPTLTPLPPGTPPSAANQVRNGEFGHSVDTWFNPPPGSPTLDVGKEAAFWFTNDPPMAGQLLDFTTAQIDPVTLLSNPINHTLKAFINDGGVHTGYLPEYCDWDRLAGECRLTGDKTIDALLPNNRLVIPNRAVAYFGALIALRNSSIRVPAALRIFAGIWDNTVASPRPDWAAGTAFIVDHLVRGTPAGTTQRNYKILAYTDRGYSYLSEEEIVANAPNDASYGPSDVLLSWQAIPGILQYKVYRFDVVANKYRLLSEIGSGVNNYVDNGVVLNDDVGGYPAATTNTPRAYVATQSQDLQNLPVDGQPWAPLFLNIPVPSDYDVATTTGEQVLRIGMTIPLDRELVDAKVNNASTNLFSDSAEFTSQDIGRTVVITGVGGDVLTTTISALVDDENVTLAAPWGFVSVVDAAAYITGGGDHGLLIDAIHLSYVSGSAFAANADDINRLSNGGQNPITAPSSSSQGGAGGGGLTGGGEGGITEFGCVALDCPITVLVGNGIESAIWQALQPGETLFSGDLRPNWITRKPKVRTLNLHIVRIKLNWLYDIEVPCSPRHPLITNYLDSQGRAVENLRPGDNVLVSINGHVLRKPIRSVVATGEAADVGTFSLHPGHIYSAGRPRPRSWWARLLARFFPKPIVGALAHNAKVLNENVI